jgi:leader peptidase (prepilin peptidase)/N-methyltransferase
MPVVLLAAAAGAAAGPWLRAMIFRYAVPAGPWRRDCPACRRVLALAGGVSMRGRCPFCGARIGPPPGAVELTSALTLALLVVRPADRLASVTLCGIGLVGVVLAFIDVAVHRLPNPLTLILAAAALMVPIADGRVTPLLCGLAVATGYAALVLINPHAMGTGDAKLAFGLGVVLGWTGWSTAVLGTLAGLALSAGYGALMLVLRRIGRKDPLPHGPFMLLGALLTIVLAG